MATKALFASLRDALIPQTDTVNFENPPAYALAPEDALAQMRSFQLCRFAPRAVRLRGDWLFRRTSYATADEQLMRVLEQCEAVDPEFIARLAIYSPTRSFMKDMPALLCAWLSAGSVYKKDLGLHEVVFCG